MKLKIKKFRKGENPLKRDESRRTRGAARSLPPPAELAGDAVRTQIWSRAICAAEG